MDSFLLSSPLSSNKKLMMSCKVKWTAFFLALRQLISRKVLRQLMSRKVVSVPLARFHTLLFLGMMIGCKYICFLKFSSALLSLPRLI